MSNWTKFCLEQTACFIKLWSRPHVINMDLKFPEFSFYQNAFLILKSNINFFLSLRNPTYGEEAKQEIIRRDFILSHTYMSLKKTCSEWMNHLEVIDFSPQHIVHKLNILMLIPICTFWDMRSYLFIWNDFSIWQHHWQL